MKLSDELIQRARLAASQCHDCTPQKLTEKEGLYLLPADCELGSGTTPVAEIGVGGTRYVIYLRAAA